MAEQNCYVIGGCGQSCSGKTTVCKQIKNTIRKVTKNAPGMVVVVHQDSYYKGGNKDTNYDIPDAICFDDMYNDITSLINKKVIESPIYDFKTHSRKTETKKKGPAKFIIIEGILIFSQERIRDLCHLKVFVLADSVTMFARRLKRDTEERGRTSEEVTKQYLRDVVPSSHIYVDPYVRFAHIALINNVENEFVGFDILKNSIKVKVIKMLKINTST